MATVYIPILGPDNFGQWRGQVYMYAKSWGIYHYVTTHYEIDSEADPKTRKYFYELGLAISSSVGPELKHLVNLDTMDEAYTCQWCISLKKNSNCWTMYPNISWKLTFTPLGWKIKNL